MAIAKTKSLTRFLISVARQRFTFYLKINTNPIPKQFNYICWPRKGHCCIHTVSDCDCHRNNKWILETRLIAVLFYHSAFLCIWTLKLCGLTHRVHHFTSLSRMNAFKLFFNGYCCANNSKTNRKNGKQTDRPTDCTTFFDCIILWACVYCSSDFMTLQRKIESVI